ncbi:substrate-binding domain-containing protein [Vallitalea sp.]|uniref:substrate-binding domain-containing protein n=1 Tax=Vallitalea sp. TaxID=1882829 RepID=UPI002ED1CFE8|nr:substrate-binding domain-containing protein [Vallitalea sp.]
MGYKPLRKRKNKTQKQTFSIVMIHNDEAFTSKVDRAFYFSIRNGIEQICIKKKINVFSVPITQLPTTKQQYDGAIIFGNLTQNQHQLIRNNASTNKFAIVGLYNPFPDEYDHISFNTRFAVYKVLDYLIALGHTKIGCLGANEFSVLEDEDSRKKIFTKYMTENNLYRDEWVIFGHKGTQGGYEMAEKLIKLDNLPTALFVANDPTAIGVIQALQDNGIMIPADMSIIGFNGDYTTEYTYPPLTTLKVNTREMGKEAVLCLLEKIKGDRALVKKVEIGTTLIERKSARSIAEQ